MQEEKKNKMKKTKKNAINGALFSIYIALIILIIIWLFKLIKNTKSEPKNRKDYIAKEPSNYYEEQEFCFYNYENFILKGAIITFDLRIKKIEKYSKAVVSTLFIGIGSIIMSAILVCCLPGCAALFYLFFIISVILCLSFSIVLAHHYFKSNFSDFEEFSKCRYLTKQFKTDYDFIFKIKDEFKMPFVLVLFTEFLNCFSLVYEYEDND